MSDQQIYQVQLNWIEDRKGILQSDVLNSKIEVVTLPEFPKGIEGYSISWKFKKRNQKNNINC